MQRIKSIVWGSRKRRITAGIFAALLVVSSTAIAAFIIYSGASGSGGGTFEASSTVDALTISTNAAPELSAGEVAPFPIFATNNDPTTARKLASISATFSSSVPACATHLSLQNLNSAVNVALGPGQGPTQIAPLVTVTAAAGVPIACAGATWSVAFTGTTVAGP